MVTEKDLYQNIRIDCNPKDQRKSKSKHDFYRFDIENKTMVLEIDNHGYGFYTIENVLYHLNKKDWKIANPINRCIEIW